MDLRKYLLPFFLCIVLVFGSNSVYAQALSENQIISRLNSLIRAKGVSGDQQIEQLNTLIASANALHAESTENALLAYKLLVSAQVDDLDPVKTLGNSVLALAVRGQDYRSQSYVLRALLRYQSVVSPNDVISTKQRLLGLLTRRLSDTDQAQILLDIGLADIKTGNVMSALDFLNQAQSTFWEQSDFAQWRNVVETQVDLLLDMQWFTKAHEKQQLLADFIQNQSGQMPFKITNKLLSIIAAENQWQTVEDLALKMLDAGVDSNNVHAQFMAGCWLMHVNLQQQNYALVARWNAKLADWLKQNPSIEEPMLLRLDQISYLIAQESIESAQMLQIDITLPLLKQQDNSYLTIRQHLINQVALAKVDNDIGALIGAYEVLIAWLDEERNRALGLTMDQISQDFTTMQQSTQREIALLNQSLATEKSRVGEESLFNNLLIGIVGVLLLVIAMLSYFYIRLKTQKQSQRRRRRMS